MILTAIQILLLTLVGGMLFYLFLQSLLARCVRQEPQRSLQVLRRFAIVIPAHDEESTIGTTVHALRCVEYPSELFDVIVIADNCADRTAEVARAGGASVVERNRPAHRGKGYALRWCFDSILTADSRYDGVVVCDADTLVPANLLHVMNAYLEQGSLAIQCNNQVHPASDAWSPEATRLGFLLYNYVRPSARKRMGGTSGLRGNGMCFASSLLRAIPWDAYSRNEDLEYALTLLLHGVKVDFAPEATVLATMPVDARNAVTQRARWETGRYPLIRKYWWPLLRGALTQRSYVMLDALVDLVTPPLVNLMTGAIALAIATAVLWALEVETMGVISVLWGVATMFGVGHIAIGLARAPGDRITFRSLISIPRYVFWKMGLYIRYAAQGGTREWVRTTREPSRSPEKTETI